MVKTTGSEFKISCKNNQKLSKDQLVMPHSSSPLSKMDSIYLSWLESSDVCRILHENQIAILSESCWSIRTFNYTYTFHRILTEEEGCLQDNSFQHFHNLIFIFKNGAISAFFKFDRRYKLNNELLKWL